MTNDYDYVIELLIISRHGISTFTVTQLDTKDERIARELFKTRQNAMHNGNAVQLALFKERFGWNDKSSDDTKE